MCLSSVPPRLCAKVHRRDIIHAPERLQSGFKTMNEDNRVEMGYENARTHDKIGYTLLVCSFNKLKM